MSIIKISRQKALAIFTILIEECGANPIEQETFVQDYATGTPVYKWRFRGNLGFGGKINLQTLTVDCYLEDKSLDRQIMINRANARLVELAPEE